MYTEINDLLYTEYRNGRTCVFSTSIRLAFSIETIYAVG